MKKRIQTKLPPLERYFSVLEAVATASSDIRLSDIAEICRLPPSTIHRILGALIKSGAVRPKGDKNQKSGGFVLGERLLRLVLSGSDAGKLRVAAQPLLDDLARRLGETCYLVKLCGLDILSIAWAAPANGLQSYVVPGDALPAHAAATAKATLAFQKEDVVSKILTEPFAQFTPVTKTDPVQIYEELSQVRNSGYAICWNEIEMGLVAVACPVMINGLGGIYSVGVTGLIQRMQAKFPAGYIPPLKETAERLSSVITYSTI